MDALFAAPIGALLIFALRVVDVTMGTFRMILMVRGYRALAAGLSFIEIMIWVLAAGHALQHLHSWLHVTGYAAGFATGTYVGIGLENRFALGLAVIKVFCREQDDGETVAEPVGGSNAAERLREAGMAVTAWDGQGKSGPVRVLHAVLPRKRVDEALDIIDDAAPEAFTTVQDVREAVRGYLPLQRSRIPVWRRG